MTKNAKAWSGKRCRNSSPFPVLVLTDPKRGADPLTLVRHLKPGSALVFRHYDMTDRSVYIGRLATLCRSRRIVLWIGGPPERRLCRAAEGFHFPSWLMRDRRPLKFRLGNEPKILASVHNREEILRALRLGVDGVLLSPVFPTSSHSGAQPLGAIQAGAIAGRLPVAVYALGGLSKTTVRRLPRTAFSGIAGISLQGL